jgi:hypothetical protein
MTDKYEELERMREILHERHERVMKDHQRTAAEHGAIIRSRRWEIAVLRFRSPLWVRGNIGRYIKESFGVNDKGVAAFDFMQAWRRK